jgi:hypothetical protein
MIFKGKSRFIITNKINISDCIWNLSGMDSDAAFIHFLLQAGRFECNKMLVNLFDNVNLSFLNSTNSSINYMNFSEFTLKNCKTNKEMYFIVFAGEINVTDSV